MSLKKKFIEILKLEVDIRPVVVTNNFPERQHEF